MKPLVRDSEPYSARGNVASKGVSNQLGRPRLDPLAVFVRESVQNCWDAHCRDDPHVEVEIGLRTLTMSEVDALRAQIFADPAPETGLMQRLEAAASGEAPMRMLWIADRNTTGLGGPTRADAVSDSKDVPTDFVDLLRNVGQPPDKADGGGTFGYGKAALFLMSQVQTLLVHTHCLDAAGKTEARLMGVALGDQYFGTDHDGRHTRYTGRHWWGVAADDGFVDPALGAEADQYAASIGLPIFEAGASGTTIAILDPRFTGDRNPRDAMNLIIESLLWNFWPKLIATDGGRPAIRLRVQLEDEALHIPDPQDFPPLDGFVKALEHLDDFSAGRTLRFGTEPEPITWHGKTVGVLSLVRTHRRRRGRLAPKSDLPIGGIEAAASSHVALMRTPRLIVKYLPFEPLLGDSWEYAGVFVANPEFDRAFAHAEPPTHDDWVVAQLTDDNERSIVRVTLRRIGEKTRAFADPTATLNKQTRSEGLAPLSARLGEMLVGVSRSPQARPKVRKSKPRIKEAPELDEPGESAQPPNNPQGASGHATAGGGAEAGEARPPGRPAVRLVDGGAELRVHEGVGVLATRFVLKHGVRTAGTRLRAQGWARLVGGVREKEPPQGATVPTVVGWRDPTGALITDIEPVASMEQAGEWTVLMTLLDDASIDVVVRGEGVPA